MVIPYHRPYYPKGIITNGKYCRILENKIGSMYGMPALACSSGTIALLFAFEAVQNKLKDAMPHCWSIPSFTWYSDQWVLNKMHLRPHFRDIDPEYWLMENRMTDCAQFPTLTFGNTGEYWGDYIIYDATHCLGARLPKNGLAYVFSLSATKLVTGCEGGILLAEDPVIFNHAAYLRDKYGRLSEPNAEIAFNNYLYLSKFVAWKKKVFRYYQRNIEGEVQWQKKDLDHNRNTIGFVSEDIEVPYQQIQYKQYYEPLVKNIFTNTEYIYKNIKCLPSYYGCDYKKIVEIINEYNSRDRKQLEGFRACQEFDWSTRRYRG